MISTDLNAWVLGGHISFYALLNESAVFLSLDSQHLCPLVSHLLTYSLEEAVRAQLQWVKCFSCMGCNC